MSADTHLIKITQKLGFILIAINKKCVKLEL